MGCKGIALVAIPEVATGKSMLILSIFPMLHQSINIILTIPIQFLRILQILKSFLENIGAGRLVLKQHKHMITQ